MPINLLLVILILILLLLILLILLIKNISSTIRRIKMTQIEAHDKLLAALNDLKTEINAAAARVAAAVSNPEQTIDTADLFHATTDATNTVKAILPSIVP